MIVKKKIKIDVFAVKIETIPPPNFNAQIADAYITKGKNFRIHFPEVIFSDSTVTLRVEFGEAQDFASHESS